MRIVDADILHCSAGAPGRTWSFLRMRSDSGHVGWAEFTDGRLAAHGLAGVVEALLRIVAGEDPSRTRRIETMLEAATRDAPGGLNRRAAATIVNACLDLHARALGASVAELLGGAVRSELPLYWSHCGLGRIRTAEAGHGTGLQDLDAVRALGAEVRERGFRALKTNLLIPTVEGIRPWLPSRDGAGFPEREISDGVIAGILDVLRAFRDGAGDGVDLYLDVNFNLKRDGLRRLAAELPALGVGWLEVDAEEPATLATARASGLTLASGETLSGVRAYREAFARDDFDVPVIDVAWNGVPEAMRIADLADSHELDIAPHNYGSHLLTAMNAQFAAAVPNLRTVEIDVDGVPWRDDLIAEPLEIRDGVLVVPDGPGWGVEVDEDALRRHDPAKEQNRAD